MVNRAGVNALVLVLVACGRPAPPRTEQTAGTVSAGPAGELALRMSGGAEIWFGDAREGRDSAGATCLERTLEIRGPDGRRIVPLLYTLDTPTVLDDSTVRARLFTDCRPGPTYRVSLKTGLPVRKEP